MGNGINSFSTRTRSDNHIEQKQQQQQYQNDLDYNNTLTRSMTADNNNTDDYHVDNYDDMVGLGIVKTTTTNHSNSEYQPLFVRSNTSVSTFSSTNAATSAATHNINEGYSSLLSQNMDSTTTTSPVSSHPHHGHHHDYQCNGLGSTKTTNTENQDINLQDFYHHQQQQIAKHSLIRYSVFGQKSYAGIWVGMTFVFHQDHHSVRKIRI